MKRLLITLAAVLSLTLSARADSIHACAPNCGYSDVGPEAIKFPDTVFTTWKGDFSQMPYGDFSFNMWYADLSQPIFSTTLDGIINLNYLAYALCDCDWNGTMRHAKQRVGTYWANWANGVQGWSRDTDGLISYSPPVDSAVPEPSTWLLMATGVLGMILLARNQRFRTMMSSNEVLNPPAELLLK